MKIGETLRQYRRNNVRMTLKEVNEKTGLSISFLSDIERGTTNPSLDTIYKLANCYNVSVRDLIPEKEEKRSIPESLMKAKTQMNIPDKFIDLMMQVQLRSEKQFKNSDEWIQLYFSLKTIIGE